MLIGAFSVLCVDCTHVRMSVYVHGVYPEVSKSSVKRCRYALLAGFCIGNTSLRTKIRTGFRIHVRKRMFGLCSRKIFFGLYREE